MKFKVGDRVKVIARKHGHFFDNGEVVKIKEINRESYMCSSLERNNIWWLGDDEVSEVKFTKTDLKDYDIVTERNRKKRIVLEGFLRDDIGEISLTDFTENLKDVDGVRENDIVKVERPVKYETVFERKEEILDETEKRYLASVIKPFRHKIKSIEKTNKIGNSSLCYLEILLKDNDNANLPDFKIDSMYKGMESNKKYSLKELEL